jgi:hypothetical protein
MFKIFRISPLNFIPILFPAGIAPAKSRKKNAYQQELESVKRTAAVYRDLHAKDRAISGINCPGRIYTGRRSYRHWGKKILQCPADNNR